MKILKTMATAALLTLGAAQSQMVFAEPIFQPVPANQQSTLLAPANNYSEKNTTFYKLKPGLVKSQSNTLELNLLPKLNLMAHKLSAQQNEQGSLVWKGRIGSDLNGLTASTDEALTDDSVILIKRSSGITGTVRTNGRLFKIRPIGNGLHSVSEVIEDNMPTDHPPGFDSEPVNIMPQESLLNFETVESLQAQNLANSNIRVLVAYTSAAKSKVSDMQGLIELAVAETNTGYSNSGVNATLTLAHTYQVNYSESSFSTDLKAFRRDNDGQMDEVHGKRDQYGADVAVLITNVSDYCGIAALAANSSTAYAVVYHSCATGYYSFGHEIGHLMSARHDPNTDSSNTPYAFGHGFQYPSANWRTIMAYNCSGGCSRINWWSNPNKTRNGVAMGTSSRSDNARVLNITAPTVANFKSGSTPPTGGGGELTKGQAETGIAGSQGSDTNFYLDVPAGSSDLSFVLSGGSGDADMYVKFGSQPTSSSYDCRPYKNGNNESCPISNIQSGRYYVMLKGYSSYSGVSLKGDYALSVDPVEYLSESNLSGAKSSWKHYEVTIPSGMSTFAINMSGGSGDADLYVRRSSKSTTSSYQCRPYKSGNSETCTVDNPQAGTWFVSVRAYAAYSGVDLEGEWQ